MVSAPFTSLGRCFKPVDSVSEQLAKLITVDEEPDYQIVHPFRFGKADRTAHQALDSRPQLDVLTCDFLGVVFAHPMLLGIEMPLVSAPAIGVVARDAKGFQAAL
jgi:hypothetical protein